MSIEQQRVTVRLDGVCDNRTGEGWSWTLRGGRSSRQLYPTAAEAKRAGERAWKKSQGAR